MTDPSKKRYMPVYICILAAVLAGVDYLLFGGDDYLWPFFWLPYSVYMIIYLRSSVKTKSITRYSFMIYAFILIPVFAGFTMGLAWMANVNFWGEQIGR